jgi:hypothetical protein
MLKRPTQVSRLRSNREAALIDGGEPADRSRRLNLRFLANGTHIDFAARLSCADLVIE